MKKLLFIVLGLFTLTAFTDFNKEDIKNFSKVLQQIKQEQGDVVENLCQAIFDNDNRSITNILDNNKNLSLKGVQCYKDPKHGEPILVYALEQQLISANITEKLLLAGADPNEPDNEGYYPLLLAMNEMSNFELLLHYGAKPSVSIRKDGQYEALHNAVMSNWKYDRYLHKNPIKILQLLIDHKININARNAGNETILDYVINDIENINEYNKIAEEHKKRCHADSPRHCTSLFHNYGPAVKLPEQQQEILEFLKSSGAKRGSEL